MSGDTMSEKRFNLINGVKKGTHSGIWDNRKQHNIGIGDELWFGDVVAMLNEGVALVEENKELKLQLEAFKDKLCELGVSDVKLYGKRYYTGFEEWLNE